MPGRIAFVLIDGLGDVNIEQLGNQTPLQAAKTPNMDWIARNGLNGLLDPVEPGLACGSDTAHLNILGYPPRIYYRGRGAFESMGAGLEMQVGDIAFKSNFATIDPETNIVVSRRADRNFEEEGPILCEYLDGIKLPSFPQHTVAIKYATEHRCGVRIRGPRLSDAITGTDPLVDDKLLVKCKPVGDDPSGDAQLTCDLIEELSREIHTALMRHPINAERIQHGKSPANVILFRGAGARIDVTPFSQLHKLPVSHVTSDSNKDARAAKRHKPDNEHQDKDSTHRQEAGTVMTKYGRGFMIAPTCIIRGLAMSLDLDIVTVANTSGDYKSDLLGKGIALVEELAPEWWKTSGKEHNHQKYGPGRGAVTDICKVHGDYLDDAYTFGFLHIKAVDDTGHDRNVALKVKKIEECDQLIGVILENFAAACQQNPDLWFTIVITGDHSTPVRYGDHSCEPVPFTICQISNNSQIPASSIEDLGASTLAASTPSPSLAVVSSDSSLKGPLRKLQDAVQVFSENCAHGGQLGRFAGNEVMSVILRFNAVSPEENVPLI
eukprot:TRINITY_DN8442_c0_g1::TRINITY_DN8442_c0_g1_i1::g.3413::m.3413 TRINITY_DN8442_c0_g1::TRINITY_DN8442_c0_g1_i1::g.3413  ORF type:complete len:550 (-),score=45.26,sp/Q975P3/APGM_SULTO/32.10/9e-69,PhosphMutase/PF10143.4/1.9e-57,Metalloenzyme/PF01676.13/4.2e-09,Metalloenzyme/PF01676.13/1.4e-16 TRINITY_DN8442_c0_g1_i1:261-1910(-)